MDTPTVKFEDLSDNDVAFWMGWDAAKSWSHYGVVCKELKLYRTIYQQHSALAVDTLNAIVKICLIMMLCFRWAEMQQNPGVAMVSYPENLNSTGQSANSTPPDQAVFEADKRAVYK